MQNWAKVILVVAILNILSFAAARVYWWLSGKTGGVFKPHLAEQVNQEIDERIMTYLIAGNMAQPESAFEFMKSEFGQNYTYVSFSIYGWNAKTAAKYIAEDIKEHDYKARVFTISLGDHVARYLEADVELKGKLEIYVINPCPNRSVLQKPYDTVLRFCAPLAKGACYMVGWLSVLPVIPCDGGNYSLILLIDQFYGIYYDSPPLGASQTYGIVCSQRDEFIRNEVVEKIYLDAEIAEIDTVHGDTAGESSKYYDAISNLIQDNAP